MEYQFSLSSDERFLRVRADEWRHILSLAEAYGWNPAYMWLDYVPVKASYVIMCLHDTKAIARALERAVADIRTGMRPDWITLTPSDLAKPEKPTCMRELLEAAPLPTRWLETLLEDVIRLVREGSVTVTTDSARGDEPVYPSRWLRTR